MAHKGSYSKGKAAMVPKALRGTPAGHKAAMKGGKKGKGK